MSYAKILIFSFLLLLMMACDPEPKLTAAETEIPVTISKDEVDASSPKHRLGFNDSLPTIGILMYDGVLTTEVTAAAEVFTKPAGEGGDRLFNVVTIAETDSPVLTEENLTLVPDHTFSNAPKLTVLFVPSAYDMYTITRNEAIVDFIRNRDKETEYTVSNCGGAQLIGASGIAGGKKIVTWIGGGKQLQEDYPELLVQDDDEVTFVRDGKYFSSNGNLASFVSALELIEVMTSKEHRDFVESYLYLDRLQNWK